MVDEAVACELLARLAACVCEGEEVAFEDVRAALAASIDQTMLDPVVGPDGVLAWARENACQGFATLCVQPYNVGRVAWELAQVGSPTGVCCVLSYPYGQDTMEGVCFQVALACAAGATELDLVANYGAFLEESYDAMLEPVEAALRTIDADLDCEDGGDAYTGDESEYQAHCTCGCGSDGECGSGGHTHEDCGCHHGAHHADDPERPLLKVVLETGHLTPGQTCRASDMVSSLGVDFIQASTGCGPRDVTAEDVRLMRATAEPSVQVKAAGAIRTLADAICLLEAGATRLGTPYGRELLSELDALGVACGLGDRIEA